MQVNSIFNNSINTLTYDDQVISQNNLSTVNNKKIDECYSFGLDQNIINDLIVNEELNFKTKIDYFNKNRKEMFGLNKNLKCRLIYNIDDTNEYLHYTDKQPFVYVNLNSEQYEKIKDI